MQSVRHYVINPNWVELVENGKKVEEVLSISKLPELAIPEKLWTVLDAAKDGFRLEHRKDANQLIIGQREH